MEYAISGEIMKNTIARNSDDGWTSRRKFGILVMLIIAAIAAYVLPLILLLRAAESAGGESPANHLEQLSLGLVALGPSLFTTTFLAMSSQFRKVDRWGGRAAATVWNALVHSALFIWVPQLGFSLWLSVGGVVFAIIVDGLTPTSPGDGTIDVSPNTGHQLAGSTASVPRLAER